MRRVRNAILLALLLSMSLLITTVWSQVQGAARFDSRTSENKIAEIRFFRASNHIDYLEGNLRIGVHLNNDGTPRQLENLETGARVELQNVLQENLADLHSNWDRTYKKLSTLLDIASVAEDHFYRARMIFFHHLWSQAGFHGQTADRSQAKSWLERTVAQHKQFDRISGILDSVGWALALNHDLHGFRSREGSTWDQIRDYGVLGRTSERAMGKLLTHKVLEPMLHRVPDWKIRSAMPSQLRGHGFGVFDDVTGHSARSRYFAKGFAAGIRSSIAGSMLGIGYDRLRGEAWASPDMVGHYLDIALTVGWANVPGLQGFAPAVASIRQIGTEVTRKPVESVSRFFFMLDDFSPMRASELYSLAGMTLHGVNPSIQVATDTLNALDRNPTISRNKHYLALKQAFQAGDKAAAAEVQGLRAVMQKGGIELARFHDMRQALQTAGTVKPAAHFSSAERHLGGVSLRAVPDWDRPLGTLTGFMYDGEQEQLVLVGDGHRRTVGIRIEDLASAFACVFGVVQGNRRILGGPEFSLDPYDETKPDGSRTCWLRINIPDPSRAV